MLELRSMICEVYDFAVLYDGSRRSWGSLKSLVKAFCVAINAPSGMLQKYQDRQLY